MRQPARAHVPRRLLPSSRSRSRPARASRSCAPRSPASRRAVPAKSTDQTPRLPIDRVFTVRGFGTVVTGTLTAGDLAVDDRVEVYPRGVVSKVRGLQVHGTTVERASAGQRTAVNLQAWSARPSSAATSSAPPGALLPTLLADATLELLEDAPRPLKTRDRVRFHVGTQEVMARVLLVDRPGARARPGLVRPVPAGGAHRRAARRPLRDPLLLAHRHHRRRHAPRRRTAALQAQGAGAARAPSAARARARRPRSSRSISSRRGRRARGRPICAPARPSAPSGCGRCSTSS